MSITKKTLSPYIVELHDTPVTDDGVLEYSEYVEDAGKVTVYTAQIGDTSPTYTTLTGSGLNAALNVVAAGATYATDPAAGVWTGSTIDITASSSNVILQSISVKGAIYGGALALDTKGKITKKYIEGVSAVVDGDVSITLQNTNAKAVYGGGAGYGAVVTGDASISYSGGNISKMFGGGYTGSVVEGDVSIFIDGRATGKIGAIYAGGYNSVVEGDATVTFTNNSGLYNNLSLGTVSGGGYGKAARIDGTSTLVFDNYSGNFKATIKDFDLVTISGKSSVILVKGQNKTMKGATFEFVINEDTFGLQGAMLTWNSKVLFSNVVVSVETTDAIDVTLIQSKYFKTASDFSIDSVLVVNEDDEKLSTFAYELTYNYDKKLGGSVSISYNGLDLVFNGTETKKIVLSGADDEVNVVSGGKLAAGLSTSGGNDVIRLQSGAEVNGGIQAGTGDDSLYIQKDVVLTGEVAMGDGDDTVSVESGAEVTSNISLGAGVNTLTVQRGASMTGTIIFANGSTNTVVVNGAVMDFSGGDATTNNTITLSGDSVNGGGVGYWTQIDDNSNGYWTKLDVFVVRDLILSGEANDTVIVGNGASVNNIYLGGGNDKLIINQGANIGYDYVSAADWTTRGNAIAATINLGTGNDVLVLNAQLGDNVNVITADDGGDVIVIGADMAINDNQLLVGSTNNTLVVANGRQVTFNDVLSWGNFISGSTKYDAFYLSQNAIVNFEEGSVIENYTGTLSRDGDILVIGAPTAVPAEIAAYYTAGNGVTNSSLYAEDVDLADGGKITSSKVIAENVYVHGGTSIDNSASGFVSVEDYILVSNNASVSGTIYLGYEPTHELSSGATADIAGTVDAIVGGADSDQVNVTSGTASIGSIDLGAGEDTVVFSSGTFADADLVIANTETIVLGSGADVTVGEATGYGVVTLGLNSKFTEIVTQTVTIGDWDTALSFADGYTVRLNGTVDADVTLNNNTVLITSSQNYFAENINLNGANTFSIQDGVQGWYDWQQFKFGVGATLGFKLGEDSFFALDGFVGPTADAASIVASTEFGQNSGLGLGDWIYVQDWNGAFEIAAYQNIFGTTPYAPNLGFENLNVVAGAEIYGYILMDNQANQVVINDGVVINGDTNAYDYAAILTGGGDDTVFVGEATINGRIETDDGDDTVLLDGTTINTAINQGVPAVELGEGDDLIAMAGATVNGDVAFGSGDDQLTSVGTNSITGDIIFGADDNTIDVIDGTLTAGEISFDGVADNNTIEVEAGATFNVESPVALSAQNTNTVEIDGGTFGVDGLLALEATENEVILSNGGNIAGLGDLAMLGAVNTLELADATTSQAADTVNMTGSINLVQNAGTLTATDSVEMIAGGLNHIVNSATGSIQADSLAMVGDISDTVISGTAVDLIDNEGALTADSILLAADSVTLNNQGTVSAGNLMANDGIATDDFGYQIAGSTQILVNNAEGASLVASGDIKLFSESNSLVNAGSVQAGNLLMADNEMFTTGVSDTFDASDVNLIQNQESGILNVGDVTMFGELNTIANEGFIAAGDILMADDTLTDLTDGSEQCDAANGNEIDDFGTMTADSLSMAGVSNNIQLAGFVGTDNVGGSLDVAETLVMGGNIEFESGALSLVQQASENTISLATGNAVDADQTNAVTASLDAAVLAMIATSNVIDATAAYDASVGAGASEGRTLQVGAVSQSITAGDLFMAGGTNQMNFGVSALANGEYTTGLHLESRLELGTIAQTLDADVEMRGSSNALNLGIDLTSTEEGNLVVSGIAVNTTGDITMVGLSNTLTASATLLAGTQSVLDLQGDVAIAMDGDISMSGNGTNTIDFGATLTGTPAALPGESGGVINLNGNEVKVTVDGDILMVGTDAVNTLNIGENTYYTGSVTMGEVYGDDLSAENVLNVAEIGNITFNSLSMTAVTNTVTLNGQGSIGTVEGIQGGTNDFTIGKNVSVESPIVFRDIIDADLIGTEGYTILANTSNTVMLYGTAAGIDSSATNADDTFQVVGGLVTGDILTGSSASGDLVSIGNVTQGAWDAGLLNARQTSVVEGDVTMGTADSVGGNTLNILSSIVLDEEGNEVGFDAGVEGDVTMTSTAANVLTVVGADTTPDVDENFTRFAAEIGGSVTMTGSDNTATLFFGSIGGTVTATATVTNNQFTLFGFTIVGNTVLNAKEGNFVTAAASTMADVDMTAVNVNTIQLVGFSAAGDISMTATDGFNTATVWNSTTGSIDMTAEQIAADASGITNTLELSGQVVLPADLTQDAPTVTRTTVTGDVTMTALTDNTLRIGLRDSGYTSNTNFGSVTITGALIMAALANTITVWAGTETTYVNGPEDGTELDLRALVGSIAMDGQTNLLKVKQGELGVTTGGVTLANLDDDGDVIAAATNTINVNDDSLLILEEDALGERQAISLGNASVDLGGVITSGEYGDVNYTYVERDANGYETYYYEWKDTSTTDPDTAAATDTNTVTISGKIFAGDLTMTGHTNTISIVGPAVQDPDQVTLSDYDFSVATLDVGDIAMYGATNTVTLSSLDGYDVALIADSLTMGDVVVTYDTGTVKILAETNELTTEVNTYITVGGVTMTATTSNDIEVADYARLISANASDLVAGDGNKLVANVGNYDSVTNPYMKEVDDTTLNTLGDVAMAANGVYDTNGDVVTDGANTLSLGKNSAASDVTMTGYTNTVTLAGDSQATYYEVDPVTGLAVMDGLDQKTETVTLQDAAVIEDLVFHLPAGMAGIDPTNTLTMGAGSTVASVTSTDTWEELAETYGAVDTINMGERSTITGDVTLGYGNDAISMTDGSEIAGSVYFGAGADTLSITGSATVHAVDFGTNVPTGDTLTLDTDATLTVEGDISFTDTLNVIGATGASIVFADGFAFKSVGTEAKLKFTDLTTFGDIDSQDITVYGTLSMGNGTLSNGTMTFDSAANTLNIVPQKDAEGTVIGATFDIASTATVLFSDAGTWLYDGTVPVTYGQPCASDDTLAIGEDAKLVLDGLVNFGTGANQITLGKNAIFEVNQAWSADIAAVNANDEPVNVDGETEAQATPPFVPLTDSGTVGITMATGSKLDAKVDISAADGITLVGYYVASPEEIGSYTITGIGTITANVGVSDSDMAYKLDLSAEIEGNVTFGSGADTLTVSADSEADALTFGLGADSLVLGGDLSLTGLSYSGTLAASGTGTVEVGSLTCSTALTTTGTVVWDVDTFSVTNTSVTGKLVLSDEDNDLALTSSTLGDIDLGDGDDEITGSGSVTVGTVTADDLTISGGTLTYTAFNVSGDMTVDNSIGFTGASSTISVTGDLTLDLGSLTAAGTLMTFSGTNTWDEISDGDFAMVMDSNDLTTGQYLNLTSGFTVDLANWNMDGSDVLTDISLKIGNAAAITDFTYDSANHWAVATSGDDQWKLSVEGGALRLTYTSLA